MPAIIWPDMEAEFTSYMRPALQARPESYAADVAVRNAVPRETEVDPWPTSGRLVVVRDDGGPTTRDVRATARLGVQVWAEDEGTCSDLANLVMALTGAWRSATVRRSEPSRPFSVTEDSGRPKQFFTAELMIRGRALSDA